MEYELKRIEAPQIEGMDDLALNIANVTQSIIKEQAKQENDIFEKCLRTMATPPIKGEITKGKIKWRGITIAQQRNGFVTLRWLEQRGERISPMIKFDYSIKDFG